MRKDKEVLDMLGMRPTEVPSGLRGLESRKTRKGKKKDSMPDFFGRGTDVFGAGKQFDPFK